MTEKPLKSKNKKHKLRKSNFMDSIDFNTNYNTMYCEKDDNIFYIKF